MHRVTVGFWLFVALIASVGATKTVLSDTLDPDLFWHLRVAGQLRAEGVGPIVDRLSYNSIKTPWTPYSWLAELFMEAVWRSAGWRSAVVAEAVMTLLIIVLIALCCLELAGRDRRMSCAVATAAGSFFAIPFLAFRPITFAIALLGVCAWLLLRDRRLEKPSRAVWLVVPLTALCTNLHLAAAVAPAWVACLLIGALWERRSVGRYAALFAATSLAASATPMLPGVIRTGLHYLGRDVMVAGGGIAEMQSPGIPTLALAALIVAVAVIKRRSIRSGEWLWLGVTALMMLRMGRFAPLLAFIAAPLLAATLPRLRDEALGRLALRATLACALLIATIRIVIGFPWQTGMDAWLNRHGPRYPVAAATFVERNIHPGTGRLVNEFNWGGYLAWRLGHTYQVFVDGRTQLYDEAFWRATYLRGDADAAEVIAGSGADVAIIPIRGSQFRAALKSLGWETVYKDSAAEVLIPPG